MGLKRSTAFGMQLKQSLFYIKEIEISLAQKKKNLS